jgi:predicted nucleic acid-binding protein
MAIIIDTNCFANVFNRKSANHKEYKPVLDWIIKGKGVIVYGGSKYKNELKKAYKYLHILQLLRDIKKVHIGNSENIDRLQKEIEANRIDDDFDDPHLPAIVIDTKCRLICSEDKRSIPFVRDRALYPNGFQVPVYYTGLRNKNILCDNYIHNDLKPLCKLRKEQINLVNRLMTN